MRLFQQMVAPIQMHLVLRPALEQVSGMDFPDVEQVCEVFADAFLRAVVLPGHDAGPNRHEGSGDE